MADHTHDCPQCQGYFDCDLDDCVDGLVCADCALVLANLRIAELLAKNHELSLKIQALSLRLMKQGHKRSLA